MGDAAAGQKCEGFIGNGPMDQRVVAVVALMKANLQRPLSVPELAHSVNLSSPHLRHLFRTETGKSITSYLKDLRSKRSRELLETTFLSVKEIAARVGQSANHFITDFKKENGVTPSQFAARYRRASRGGKGRG
jgi:transcriptional regulator GlxA family with amidase domain